MSRRKWLLVLSLLLFTTSRGIHWQLEIPDGWHVIDTPEGLAEGLHVRICSAPAATWQHPAPPPGEAAIVVTFAGVPTPQVDLFDNGKPGAEATRQQVADSLTVQP